MELYKVNKADYADLAIASVMDFADFEKLLTALNAVSGKPAEQFVYEAQSLLDSQLGKHE